MNRNGHNGRGVTGFSMREARNDRERRQERKPLHIDLSQFSDEVRADAEKLYNKLKKAKNGKAIVLDIATQADLINCLRGMIVNDPPGSKVAAWSDREKNEHGLPDGKYHFHRILSPENIETRKKDTVNKIVNGQQVTLSFDNFDDRPIVTALKREFHGDDEIRWVIDPANKTFTIGVGVGVRKAA